MVRIATKKVKGKKYYYLEHTIREKERRKTETKYLGPELPKNLDEIKREFEFELDKAKWFDNFDSIKRNYVARQKLTPGSAREKEIREFSVRFTYSTQRIEGSTLTLRETARLLEENISPSGKPVADSKEAEAHQRVFLEMLRSGPDLSLELVKDWHWIIFKDTKADIAGQIRRQGVRISGSKFLPPSPVELKPMLNGFFEWYRKNRSRLNAVELAALVHLRFVTIHPFSDGNGRISRLMMNFVLKRHQYPMLNIEYGNRASYYVSLERSQLSKNDRPFLQWLFRRYVRENEGLTL
jgi:Fic family protein